MKGLSSYDKPTLIALAACILLLVAWVPLTRWLGWSAPPAPARVAAERPPPAPGPDGGTPLEAGADAAPAAATPTPAPAPVPAPADTTAPTPSATADTTVAAASDRPVVATVFARPSRTVRLINPGFTAAEVAPDGGGIVNVSLDRYRSDDRSATVTLGDATEPFCALLVEDPRIELGAAEIVAQESNRLTVVRRAATPALEVTEEWRLDPDQAYALTYSVTVRNSGSEPVTLRQCSVAAGAVPVAAAPTVEQLRPGSDGALNGVIDATGKQRSVALKRVAKAGSGAYEELNDTPLRWIAVHSKYFLFYLKPEGWAWQGTAAAVRQVDAADGVGVVQLLSARARLPAATVAAGEQLQWHFSGYAGPKEYMRLRAIGGGLDQTLGMDLFLAWHPGWMAWLSATILRSLIAMNNTFAHRWAYGFGIIVITVVVKLLFWPLTHYSTASMRKMQKIQPLVQELRGKYKDQPDKLNRKMMELYREHKVSPLGGCLPMLLQVPVFFALFNTFRSAIELRHASFLWVADLSMPDTLPFTPAWLPVRPLALLMGGTMYLQQKTMPTSADPTQAKMMNFMTLFFIFIFYGMPAGLTLYWTVNQVLTIVQNWIVLRRETAVTTG